MRKGLLGVAVLTVSLVLTGCGESDKSEAPAATVQVEAKWYEGGTLHEANALEWQTASNENKLATAADWIAALKNANKLSPEIAAKLKSQREFKALTQELVDQLNEATVADADAEKNKQIFVNQDMDEMAVALMAMMGWLSN